MWKILISLAIIVAGLSYNQQYYKSDFEEAKLNINKLKIQVKQSFDEAESQVFKIKPAPDNIDTNPDPKKCICKGTGIIIQGDGHKSVCPYHGGSITQERIK